MGEDEDREEEPKPRGGGVVGTLTAVAALLTTLVGLVAGLRGMGILRSASPSPPSDASPPAEIGSENTGTNPNLSGSGTVPSTEPSGIVGAWTWKGQACADGPHVAYEGQRLVFTTSSTRFVHRVLSDSGGTLRTQVTSPPEHAGKVYRLRINGDTLRVFEEADGSLNVWSRCR